MFIVMYLLFAIVLAIIIGRAATVCKDYIMQYRKKHYPAHPPKQIAK